MADSTRTAFTKSCRGEVNGPCVFVKNLYQNKTVFTFEKKIFELKGDGHRVPFDWSTFDKSKKYVQLTSGQLQRVAVLDRADSLEELKGKIAASREAGSGTRRYMVKKRLSNEPLVFPLQKFILREEKDAAKSDQATIAANANERSRDNHLRERLKKKTGSPADLSGQDSVNPAGSGIINRIESGCSSPPESRNDQSITNLQLATNHQQIALSNENTEGHAGLQPPTNQDKPHGSKDNTQGQAHFPNASNQQQTVDACNELDKCADSTVTSKRGAPLKKRINERLSDLDEARIPGKKPRKSLSDGSASIPAPDLSKKVSTSTPAKCAEPVEEFFQGNGSFLPNTGEGGIVRQQAAQIKLMERELECIRFKVDALEQEKKALESMNKKLVDTVATLSDQVAKQLQNVEGSLSNIKTKHRRSCQISQATVVGGTELPEGVTVKDDEVYVIGRNLFINKKNLTAIDDVKTFPARLLALCYLYYGKTSFEKYALPNVSKKFRLQNPSVPETISDTDVEIIIELLQLMSWKGGKLSSSRLDFEDVKREMGRLASRVRKTDKNEGAADMSQKEQEDDQELSVAELQNISQIAEDLESGNEEEVNP